jgi:hypothetical protein
MNTYRHTQCSTSIIVLMLALSALFIALGIWVLRPLLVAVPILLVSGWLFHSLTIEIEDGELRWRFGPGLIHKRVPLSEITSARRVRTNVLEGWGIHISRFGWLYNVSGFDAVAITLKNGKRFALGTDEPQALLAAIAPPPGAVNSPP